MSGQGITSTQRALRLPTKRRRFPILYVRCLNEDSLIPSMAGNKLPNQPNVFLFCYYQKTYRPEFSGRYVTL